MPDAATPVARTTAPLLLASNWLTLLLPVFETYSKPWAFVTQHAAVCASETGAVTGVIVLSALTVKVSSELVPAKLRIICPAPLKTNANGTPAALFLVGAGESRPSAPTEKTSTVLFVFVVTIRCLPSRVKPTSAGERRKNGGFALASSNLRV